MYRRIAEHYVFFDASALTKTSFMSWNSIRLELARTRESPAGSAGRAFLLRLPLLDDGSIDEAEFARHPSRATICRFWASEPDSFGGIIRCPSGWECTCSQRGNEPLVFLLPSQALRLGEQVIMKSPDGRELPLRIAVMTRLG